ncbi:uncharacterized protein LOC122815299 isoform X2 [Protopterus annectens]|uniref:uncharacterized protein LOC122815299 isoform X2 n=1 Tax=Protopterus annectens TaxID=7888 RepID=UPI001CF932D7|nr:uncharacterized protein LOC122815299 isoform X2 [Protopterus annectens]
MGWTKYCKAPSGPSLKRQEIMAASMTLQDFDESTGLNSLLHDGDSSDIFNTGCLFEGSSAEMSDLSSREDSMLDVPESQSPVFNKVRHSDVSQANKDEDGKTSDSFPVSCCLRDPSGTLHNSCESLRHYNFQDVNKGPQNSAVTGCLLQRSPTFQKHKRRKLYLSHTSPKSFSNDYIGITNCDEAGPSTSFSYSHRNPTKPKQHLNGFVPATVLLDNAISSPAFHEDRRLFQNSVSPGDKERFKHQPAIPVFDINLPTFPSSSDCNISSSSKSKRHHISSKLKQTQFAETSEARMSEKKSRHHHSHRSSARSREGSIHHSPLQSPNHASSSRSGSAANSAYPTYDLTSEASANTAYVTVEDDEDIIVLEDDTNEAVVRTAQIEEDEAFARHLQAEFDKEAEAALPANTNEPLHPPLHRMNQPVEFCGIPGCGSYPALLASPFIGYCGRPGCSGNLQNFRMLSPTMLDPQFLQVPVHHYRSRRTRHTNGVYRTRSRVALSDSLLDENSGGNNYEALLAFEELQGPVVGKKRLSREEINRLPTKVFDPDYCAGKTQCHICFCDYSVGENLRILPCLHDYHTKCIDRWLKESSSCPVCRVDIEMDLEPAAS